MEADNSTYDNFNANASVEIYVGASPYGGRCSSSAIEGYANITEFLFSTPDWKDSVGISTYNFYYSYDGGEIFIPIVVDET